MHQISITDPSSIDRKHIESVITQGSKAIVQYSDRNYDRAALQNLNTICAEWGRKLEVRFYGHHKTRFDASVVRFIPDVEALSIDCLIEAENLSSLRELKHLIEFSLGVYRLNEPDLLATLPIQNLERLVISETAKQNLNLKPLEACERLKELYIVGHTKCIESMTSLSSLRTLSLAHIANKQSLDFVSDIAGLKELRILLGGRRNINEIKNQSLERLEIVRVLAFDSLDNLSAFPKLRELLVEDQIRLTELEFSSLNPMLNLVKILNCKNLGHLRGLNQLKSLSHLRIYKTALDLEKLIAFKLPENLKIFAMYTGKAREDEKLRQRLGTLGYSDGLPRA